MIVCGRLVRRVFKEQMMNLPVLAAALAVAAGAVWLGYVYGPEEGFWSPTQQEITQLAPESSPNDSPASGAAPTMSETPAPAGNPTGTASETAPEAAPETAEVLRQSSGKSPTPHPPPTQPPEVSRNGQDQGEVGPEAEQAVPHAPPEGTSSDEGSSAQALVSPPLVMPPPDASASPISPQPAARRAGNEATDTEATAPEPGPGAVASGPDAVQGGVVASTAAPPAATPATTPPTAPVAAAVAEAGSAERPDPPLPAPAPVAPAEGRASPESPQDSASLEPTAPPTDDSEQIAGPSARASGTDNAAEADERPDAPAREEETWFVTSEGVRMREEPTLSGAIVGVFSTGEEITVSQAGPEWSRVTAGDGRSGWMATRYLSDAAPAELTQDDAPGAVASEDGPVGRPTRIATPDPDNVGSPEDRDPQAPNDVAGESTTASAGSEEQPGSGAEREDPPTGSVRRITPDLQAIGSAPASPPFPATHRTVPRMPANPSWSTSPTDRAPDTGEGSLWGTGISATRN